jgi:hypothetical protein
MVGGNSSNHLEHFKERIRIKAYFLVVKVGIMCGMWGRGIKEVGEDEEVH